LDKTWLQKPLNTLICNYLAVVIMNDKTRELDGTLVKKTKRKRVASAIGAPIIAAGIALSAPSFDKTAEAGDVSREVIEKWINAGHPAMKEMYREKRDSEDFAKMETINYVNSKRGKREFQIEFDYDAWQCKKCAIIETDVARENRELAKKADIDENLALAIVYQESDMNGYEENGKVKRSRSGGYNEWQVTYMGFKEFWKILNRNKENRYKPYINAHSEEIMNDRKNLFMDPKTEKYLNKKQAWKKVKFNKDANKIAGRTLLKFFRMRENGDIFETLRDYNAGEIGKTTPESKEDSIKYAESVLKHKKFFEEVCPRMSEDRKFFRDRHYNNQISNYIASNVSNVPDNLNYYKRRN
jgi:hypothetical protein